MTYARSLRGLVPQGMPFGRVGDTSTDEGFGEGLRDLQSRFDRLLSELDAGALPPQLQAGLGGQMLMQRAGEVSGALGVDIGWQDFVANAQRELGRLQSLGDMPGTDILSSDAFGRIATVFDEQGWSLTKLRDFASGVLGNYERIGGGVLQAVDVVGDAAAYAEGGMRRAVEELLGAWTAERPTWLNEANLRAVGNAAQAWVGAAESGHTSEYVTAAGATVAAAGAVVPQPAGAIVSAVGGLITLIGALLGDEPEEPELPPPQDCTVSAGDVPWAYNPEAWAALAFGLAAKDGFTDSEVYKAATRGSKPLMQKVIYDAGWWCTIDRYTGEVMVREPSGIPGRPNPLRRLLDVVDRSVLDPRGDAPAKLEEMKAELGLVPRDPHWGGRNMLWCYPSPRETFTRYYGTAQYQSDPNVKAFRKDYLGGNKAPEHIGESVFRDGGFWQAYRRALHTSMFLAGTVPYGVTTSKDYRHARGILTGVAGFIIWQGPSGPDIRPPTQWSNPARMPWPDHIWSMVQDEAARLTGRIPNPSPEMQFDPADAIVRPSSKQCWTMSNGQQICAARPTLMLRPGAVFKRGGEGGLSTGAKWGLGIGAAALVAGGGYWAWRKWGRGR
jgi:hypothetical protein